MNGAIWRFSEAGCPARAPTVPSEPVPETLEMDRAEVAYLLPEMEAAADA